jgi:hypothetical protein
MNTLDFPATPLDFPAFQAWRSQALRSRHGLLDGGETNLYSTLTPVLPQAVWTDRAI